MMKVKMLYLSFTYLIFFCMSGSVLTQEKGQTKEEKESELIDFQNIKNVIESDQLSEELKRKEERLQVIKKERKNREVQQYNYPLEEDFFPFLADYWLVKNASSLKWDFERPDYGIIDAVNSLFRSTGLIEKKFKVLILNTPVLPHYGLPGRNNENIFLISLPFVRSMDLSKLEIALLVLEDHVRLEENIFYKNLESELVKIAADKKVTEVSTQVTPATSSLEKTPAATPTPAKSVKNLWDELKENFGQNFHQQGMPTNINQKVLDAYSHLIFERGFSFQEQYSVTKRMDVMLKMNPQLWNAYLQLLNKIDRLIKMNLLFENYNKIYPSPEMQIKWLSPQEKIL